MPHLRTLINLSPPSEQRGSTDTTIFAPTCDNG